MELVKQKKPKVTGLSTWKVFEAEGVNYTKLSLVCIKAIQELNRTIEGQQALIAALEAS